MQYKRMCVWENSSAASKEKNRIFNISQLSNTTLHTYRVFINTSVSKKYESALERSNGRSYQNFTPDRTCVLPKNTKKIS